MFGLYDIRSVNITDEFANALGASIAMRYGTQSICIGHDNRSNSSSLAYNVARGASINNNCKLYWLGLTSTPALRWMSNYLKADTSVMVTASHNSQEFNGFKICVHNEPVYGEELKKLISQIENRAYDPGTPKLQKTSILPYIKQISTNFIDPSIRAYWDCCGGVMSRIFADLFANLPNTNLIHQRPHKISHPDPMRQETIASFLHTAPNIGFAFDGDGDRVVFILDGKIITSDQLMCIFANYALQTYGQGSIITDIKTSFIVPWYINLIGGKHMFCRTGYPFVRAAMKENGALFAGEFSGHMFFQETNWDDGLYAALLILNIISVHSTQYIKDILATLPKTYSTPQINIPISDKSIINQIDDASGWDILRIDGVRASNDQGWFLLRESNTEPIMTLRCEGVSLESLNFILGYVNKLLLRYGITLPL